MHTDSFTRYLTAMRTVDDRALNRTVWAHLVNAVRVRQAATRRPLRVLELGAGVGTMVERLLAWNLFDPASSQVHYTLLDADPVLREAAHLRLDQPPAWLQLEFVAANALDFAGTPDAPGYDLLIANAFLDLLDLRSALPMLRHLLVDDGLFYFTINFDGATLFEPTIDAHLDHAVELAYHRTMDERITDGIPSGDSRTGRHLFGALPVSGFKIHAAGSSDWVVFPLDGSYPADEAYFLHFIVDTMKGALSGASGLNPQHFAEWIAARHAQIDRCELIYIAHQLDFFGVAQ